MILTEKVPAIRTTLVVDEYTFRFLTEAHIQSGSDELWVWESTEDIEYEVFLPCEECGDRYQMENYACSNNQGYCIECCECEEHFPEYIQLELPL